MTISPKKIWFDEHSLWVELSDARIIGVPLAWFPRLLAGRANGYDKAAQAGGVNGFLCGGVSANCGYDLPTSFQCSGLKFQPAILPSISSNPS